MWITPKNKRPGFTLIELLVVIAIIGILTTVASVSLIQARRRARDTRRVSDVQQLRNALVIYSNQRATYPAGSDLILGEGTVKCLDDDEFKESCDPVSGRLIIMAGVPGEQNLDPTYPRYRYTRTGSPGSYSYEIQLRLEGAIGNLAGGDCVATVDGINCTP